MINIDLAIDDQRMSLPPNSKMIIDECFSEFSSLLDRAKGDNCKCWSQMSLYNVEVEPGLQFMDVLFSSDLSPLDTDLRLALVSQINSCSNLEDLEEFELTTSKQVESWKRDGRAAACLALKVTDATAANTVDDIDTLIAFYRSVPEDVNCSENDFIEHAVRSFPRLHFKPDIHSEFRRLKEPYQSIRPKISKALAILNDRLEEICNECSNDPIRIGRTLSAEIGYATSSESPKTHKNKKAIQERMAEFGSGRSVCCEWHVKFNKTADRMHFHFGDDAIANGKVLICHFVEHFTT